MSESASEVKKMRWERLKVSENSTVGSTGGPGKRWGHTCNAIRGGKLLYVFGGYGKDNCQTNHVHVFDTVRQTWSEPLMKGTLPTPRDSHSCTTVGDNLFVFGGTDGLNPLDDLHILDTTSNTWISPNIRGERPEAREGHSATLIGKQLFIFGGCGKSSQNSDETYSSDVFILNTDTLVWRRAATSGTPPSARDSHTCSSWKNKIIVIGGEDQHDFYLSDVHILDADTLVWTELNAIGLPPRAGHSTVAFGKHLFVFGGFTDEQNLYDDLHMLNIETGVWTKLTTTGEGPSARFSVAGDSLDPLKGGVLAFIGGCNKALEALEDMYFLHTELTKDDGRPEKLSLRKQLKKRSQEQCLTPPVHENPVLRIGNDGGACQPMPIKSCAPPGFALSESKHPQGKRKFQAKVVESFPDGFAIETSIDGKPLRGILFSNRPQSFSTHKDISNRKRSAMDTHGAKLSDILNPKAKMPKPLRADSVDIVPQDGVHGKESTLHETRVEAAALSHKDGPEYVKSPVVPDENPSATPKDRVVSNPNQDG